MEDLIKALNILLKYLKDDYNKKYPTSCEHDVLYVCGVDMENITLDDVHELAKLSFTPGDADVDYDFVCICDEAGDYAGDVDFETISQEDWDNIKDNITDYFSSYRFGSC